MKGLNNSTSLKMKGEPRGLWTLQYRFTLKMKGLNNSMSLKMKGELTTLQTTGVKQFDELRLNVLLRLKGGKITKFPDPTRLLTKK